MSAISRSKSERLASELCKELKQVIKPLLEQGWTLSKKKHYKLKAPNGWSLSMSCSSGDWKMIQAIQRDINHIKEHGCGYVDKQTLKGTQNG